MAGNDKTKVVYILSVGHSGSTLLDIMLAGHPRATSVGELTFDGECLNLDRQCSCSAESLLHCSHWLRVDEILRRRSKSIREMPLMSEVSSGDNELFYQAVCSAGGAEFVVESTKSVGRLRTLAGCRQLDVHVVLLVRQPVAVVASNIRRGRSLMRYTFSYLINVASKWHLSESFSRSIVRYEALVREPAGEIGRILEEAGIEGEWPATSWRYKQHHLSGGNPIRFKTGHVLELDERWRAELSGLDRWVVRGVVNPVTLWLTRLMFVVVRAARRTSPRSRIPAPPCRVRGI